VFSRCYDKRVGNLQKAVILTPPIIGEKKDSTLLMVNLQTKAAGQSATWKYTLKFLSSMSKPKHMPFTEKLTNIGNNEVFRINACIIINLNSYHSNKICFFFSLLLVGPHHNMLGFSQHPMERVMLGIPNNIAL